MECDKKESRCGWITKNHVVGWTALSVYAFSWLINFDVSRAAETVFILCFIIAWCKEPNPKVKWHKVFLLLLAFVTLQVWVYFFAVERFPDIADGQIKAARHMTKLFLCIAVAWWLRGSINAAKYLLLVFLAGIFVSLVINSSNETWLMGLSGKRVDFGYTNAQHTAFYFGLLLIMGVCWLFRCLRSSAIKVEWALALALTMIGFCGVVVTQTRAVWLALVLILLALMTMSLLRLLKQVQRDWLRPKMLLSLVALVGVLAFTVSTVAPVIEKRLSDEQEVIAAIVEGRLDGIPMTSIGIRIHTWAYGWEKFKERPLTGWGARSRSSLIDEGPFPEWLKKIFGHFHNAYLETLLAYGVLGLTALTILTIMILRGTIIFLGSAHRYWGMGLLVSWAFFFIINMFESYLVFNSGMYFFIIVGGVGMSSYLFGKQHRTGIVSQ
ncbi:O-antigen ligase family protein [Vreelandella massiliensis]|uniref:O-antigen ligase family protein n=1 Tax=Vreelandella massiliensis TaxID=1816686 RepID=UPI00096A5214|nr:O-antigen ligase family protein [Halomonas massiliensis]